MATDAAPATLGGVDASQLGFDTFFTIDVDTWSIVEASSRPPSMTRTPRTATIVAASLHDAQQSMAELANRAMHDPVTGLPNRTLLVDRLRQSIARTQRSGRVSAVLFIGLDSLGPTADRGGAESDDDWLRDVAEQVASSLRPSDTLARLGGDEFIAICDVYGTHDARHIAERITATLVEPNDGTVSVASVAIGITVVTDAHETPDEVIARSDRAMHQAKQPNTSNIVIVERDREVVDMTSRIPLNGAPAVRHHAGLDNARPVTDSTSDGDFATSSVRRMRLPLAGPSSSASPVGAEAVIDLTETNDHVPFRVEVGYDQRIVQLERNGWGPLRPTVDLVSTSGPICIGISGHVPAIAARDSAQQLLAAAYRVKPGSLPFSANVSATIMAPFLAELALEATASDLTPNAVGVEIEAQAVRHLDFSGIEHLRALRQEGIAITIRQLDAASAHDSFLEAAAARVLTVGIAGMSRERLAQLVAIASRANVAVIAEGVDTRDDLATVTQAGCRYAQGDLFIFGTANRVADLDRRARH